MEPLQSSEDTVEDYINVIVVGVVVLAAVVLAAIVVIKCKKFECTVPTVCQNSGGEGGHVPPLAIRMSSDGDKGQSMSVYEVHSYMVPKCCSLCMLYD